MDVPEGHPASMRLDSDVTGIWIGGVRLAFKQVSVGELGGLLAIESHSVRVAPDFNFISIPLSGNQRRSSPIVLLTWVLADRDAVNGAGAVFVEAVRIAPS